MGWTGEIILVYTPLNTIEIQQFICNKIQEKLHRTINGFNDILAIYKNSTDKLHLFFHLEVTSSYV
jgi:hypothetical protein